MPHTGRATWQARSRLRLRFVVGAATTAVLGGSWACDQADDLGPASEFVRLQAH